MKKIGDVTVNDGKGLFDNEGLCDDLQSNLNNLLKFAVSGQYVAACAIVTDMSNKLFCLKKGIKADMDSMRNKVEELKKMNDALMEKQTGLPVDRGADNGTAD